MKLNLVRREETELKQDIANCEKELHSPRISEKIKIETKLDDLVRRQKDLESQLVQVKEEIVKEKLVMHLEDSDEIQPG